MLEVEIVMVVSWVQGNSIRKRTRLASPKRACMHAHNEHRSTNARMREYTPEIHANFLSLLYISLAPLSLSLCVCVIHSISLFPLFLLSQLYLFLRLLVQDRMKEHFKKY